MLFITSRSVTLSISSRVASSVVLPIFWSLSSSILGGVIKYLPCKFTSCTLFLAKFAPKLESVEAFCVKLDWLQLFAFCAGFEFHSLVAGLGVEPRFPGYEPSELPLLYPAIIIWKPRGRI